MNFYCENERLLNTVPVSRSDLPWLVLLKSSQILENGALSIASKQLTTFFTKTKNDSLNKDKKNRIPLNCTTSRFNGSHNEQLWGNRQQLKFFKYSNLDYFIQIYKILH